MPALIAWIKPRATLLLMLAAIAATAWAVHAFDQARHEAALSRIEAVANGKVAAANARTLKSERAARAAAQELDNAHAQLTDARERAALESDRLSGELDAALERLRRVGTQPARGVGVSAPASGPDSCADLRAALHRAVGAMERLQAGGDQAALDGQRAVDVATIAARAARAEAE